MAPLASTIGLSARDEWDEIREQLVIVSDGKGLITLMKRDLLVRPDLPDLSLHTPFPLMRSDSESAVSKGRVRKPDDCEEIPSSIEVRCEGIRGEDACLQLTFDGNVVAVGEGQIFPDFAKALKKHRKKLRRDALQLTFDGNVISVGEGQAFPDFAAALKQRRRKHRKKPREQSPFRGLFGSVMHAQ